MTASKGHDELEPLTSTIAPRAQYVHRGGRGHAEWSLGNFGRVPTATDALLPKQRRPLRRRAHQHSEENERHSERRGGEKTGARLTQALRRAVDAEAYEDAARLRDTIKQKEAADEPG